MTYSTSLKALGKVEKFLITLLNLKGDSVSWNSSNPSNDAYQIRQGLSIAEKTNHPEFKDLKKLFRISVKSGQVVATRLISIVDTEGTVLNSENFTKSVTVFEVKEVNDPLSVIGAILVNPHYQEYHFPDYTEITEIELSKIWKWTNNNAFYIIKSAFLIITKKEPPEGVAWKSFMKVI